MSSESQTVQAVLDALLAEQLLMIQTGSSPDYAVHGHQFGWGRYMRELDERIDACRKRLSQMVPFEQIYRVS